MKRFSLIAFLLNIIVKLIFSQTVINGGYQSGIWTQTQSPFYILGNITIHKDSILQIEPGVDIVFQGHFCMTINGILKACGNLNDSIYFLINDTTGFSDTSSTIGGWFGLKFLSNQFQDTSEIVYCNLSYGKAVGLEDEDNKGGAIYVNKYTHLRLSNSRIHHNISKTHGGGIYYNDSSSVSIEFSDISYNRTFVEGGGIYNGVDCDAYISRNVIHHNKSLSVKHSPPWIIYWGAGGGFYSSDAFNKSPIVVNNFICNNFAICGGGLYESTTGIKVIGNVICNNRGTGIYNGHQLGEGVYSNNTVCYNEKNGGISVNSWHLNIINNIVWGNTNQHYPGVQIHYESGFSPTVQYCNVEGGYAGEGNINDDPLFLEPTLGAGVNYNALFADWALHDLSPCVNSGSSDTLGLSLPEFDIANNPRIYGNRIEMGAYENQNIITCISDLIYANTLIKIFPNPTKGSFSLTMKGNRYYKVQLYNSSGELINEFISKTNGNHYLRFDITNYPDGIYLIKIFNSKSVYSKIIIKN